MSATATETTWITFGQAARRLGTSINTVRRLAESGRITVREIPGSWQRVPSSEVDHIIEQATRPRTQA